LTNNQLNDKKNNNTISFSLNNAFENNNKNKFIMIGGLNENDLFNKKLEEAMKIIDDLYSDINNNLNNVNNNNNINRKLNLNENLSNIKSEEHININSNDLLGQNNYENIIINDNVNKKKKFIIIMEKKKIIIMKWKWKKKMLNLKTSIMNIKN